MENPMKLFILAVIALMILGPSRFAGLGTTLGRTIRDFRNALRNAQDEARETFSELTGGALEATNEFRQALPSPDMFSDTPSTPTYTYDAPAAPAAADPVHAAPAFAEVAPAADEDPASLATEPTAEAARDLARQARPS